MFPSSAVRPAVRAVSQRSATVFKPSVSLTARSYAAAAPDSKPPVPLFGLDGTYANALYTAAVKSSSLEPTSKAIDALSNVFKRDPKLALILNAPTLTKSDKSQIIQELQKHTGSGGDKGDTVKNFLNTLAENNRLGILEHVCEKFGILMGASRGEMELVVTSAAKLDQKTLQRIETAISKSEYSQGKKIRTVSKINPDILGGLVVEVGERTIDLSVSYRISKLNKVLTEVL